MNKLRSGFSLVELMLAVAGIAGVGLVVMQLSKNTASTQVSAFNTADYFGLRSQIDTMFSNGYDCQATLKGVEFKATQLKATPMDIEIWRGDQNAVRTTKFLSGTDAGFKKFGKLAISSVKLSMPDYTGASNFPQGNGESFKAVVTIDGDKTQMGKTTAFVPIVKQINLTFDTDASGKSKIVDCSNAQAGGAGFGVSQTWQKMTPSRGFGATYTNSTPLPIVVNILTYITGDSGGYFYAMIDSQGPIPLSHWNKLGGGYPAVGHIIVPAGATYMINYSVTYGAIPALSDWYELR